MSDGSPLGRSVERLEDDRILDGDAEYVHDVDRSRMLHAAVLRSPHAHAEVVDVDAAPAESLDGVAAVLTGEDVAERTHAVGQSSGLSEPDRTVYATDRVRYVGEPLAVVAAETPELARRGVDAVECSFEPLPAVTDIDAAVSASPDAYLHPDLAAEDEMVDGNVWGEYEYEIGNVEAAFERADHVVEHAITTNRVSHVPLGTHGVVADYDESTGELTLVTATQKAHAVRQLLWMVLRDPPPMNKLRVVRPEYVGGGFGSKDGLDAHHVTAPLLAMEAGRPVRLVLSREEVFTSVGARTGQRHELELAVSATGEFLGIRDSVLAESGAYTSVTTGAMEYSAELLAPPYDVEHASFSARGVFTNAPVEIPYRGFGMTRVTTARETLVSKAAAELGTSPWELRRRNTTGLADAPTRHPNGFHVDSCGLAECFERAQRRVDESLLDGSTPAHVRRGLGLGVGVCPTGHVTDGGPPDVSAVTIELLPDGTLSVESDLCPIGGGTATSLAQVVADELAVEYDAISFTFGDTDRTPFGEGVGKSRSMALAGSAARNAARSLRGRLFEVAAHQLGVDADELALDAESVYVADDPDRAVPRGKLVRDLYTNPGELPDGVPCGHVSVTESFRNTADGSIDDGSRTDPGIAYAFDVHAAVVEVDTRTWSVSVLDYVVAEDAGQVLHPESARGQVQGGVVQGAAMALSESLDYADDGTPLAADLDSYGAPRADGTYPEPDVEFVETEPDRSPLGVKGVGENGAVASPATVTNAVSDALDADLSTLPLTPDRLYRAVGRREAERRR